MAVLILILCCWTVNMFIYVNHGETQNKIEYKISTYWTHWFSLKKCWWLPRKLDNCANYEYQLVDSKKLLMFYRSALVAEAISQPTGINSLESILVFGIFLWHTYRSKYACKQWGINLQGNKISNINVKCSLYMYVFVSTYFDLYVS